MQSLVHRSGASADWRDLAGLGQGAGWTNHSEKRSSEIPLDPVRAKVNSGTCSSSRTRADSTASPGSDTTTGSRSTTGLRSNSSTGRQGQSNSHCQIRSVGPGVISRSAILRTS